MIWYKDNNNDIAISTRIRLARNIDGIPFPQFLADKKTTSDKIKNAVLDSNSTLSKDFEVIELDAITPAKRRSLYEEHLISPAMLEGQGQSVLINKDRTMSCMIMEEDHLRLQVILSGFAVDEAYDTANRVDDVIEESLCYAFDDEFGYLTSCPTNAGTGLRVSVMLHLPALTATGKINGIISSASRLGIAVRGLYGEGSKAEGNLYQISNQVTSGLTEREILDKVKNIVNQITDLEKQEREDLYKSDPDGFEDKLWRSYGMLKYARSISSSEAKTLLSNVMLGRSMGILPKEGISPMECIIESEPSILSGEKNLSPSERDKVRAEKLRSAV